ncbi:PREDICTED: putative olfactory receptor 10AC1 isoform X1 [Cercocebus atys]|uniref:putative olfactory receptor 10AC1 isoform X1 n=1 Tax=Cercocebus atys TaxID=9531 RepID=UPI0005F4C5B5|nr:PREDICTED: putative olfactory receptor 10AC1 isoform X1 [Cercocebus atys]XP_011942914.1 PREDICTED: putative olfactory receptor 10AC1 isoform X1 [Cercocebus atys]XP_011942915.1 PREDICTED: putative olfactory receptor 10AC1 isoform X1 [Cercocebus atys]
MGLFVALGGSECLLLAAMALDCYLAICCPLYYPQLMTVDVCWGLLAACCAGGCILALGLTTAIFQLAFCRGSLVNHVFCDLLAMLVLACGSQAPQGASSWCPACCCCPCSSSCSPTPGCWWSSWAFGGSQAAARPSTRWHPTSPWPCSTTAAPQPCMPGP